MKKKTKKKKKIPAIEPKKTTKAKQGKRASINKVAYEVKDAKYGSFEVRNTANAWWLDEVKIEQIIVARKMGANKAMSCHYAGITTDQFDYFVEKHPEFYSFFHGIMEEPKLIAVQNLYKQLKREEKEGGSETSKWYLERRVKDEFCLRNEFTGADGKELGDISDEQTEKVAQASLRAIEEKKKLMKKLEKNKK